MSYNNLAQSNTWLFEIPDNNQTTTFQQHVQVTNLPTYTIEPTLGTGPIRKVPMPSSSAEFTPFNCRFIIDEDWDAYKSIYKWMRALADYRKGLSTERVGELTTPRTALLHLLDSSEKNIVMTFQFNALWPSELGEVELTQMNDTAEVLTCNIMFYYSEFVLLDSKGNEIHAR